jgi:YkoY family integral membrane protein
MDFFLLSPQLIDNAATVLTLIILEGLLSADNAMVLAVMVKHLPDGQRNQALRFGLLGAFVFRAIGVLLARFLIRAWYLKAAGAAWLFFLCVRHFVRRRNRVPEASGPAVSSHSFWMTVFWVECMDIAFSVDSILAAVAMSSNIYIVYLGGILGIVTMRFVAGYFLKLLDRFQGLEVTAYLIVAWIGIKLGAEVYMALQYPEATGHAGIPKWLFWSVMVTLFLAGFLIKPRNNTDSSPTLPNT